MTTSTAAISVIDARGSKHLTPFIEGSRDEVRFFCVVICSGGPFDSHKKQFFESKDVYDQFNAKVRAKIDGFSIGPPWTTGW